MTDDDSVAPKPSPEGEGAGLARPSSGRRIFGGILLVIGVLLVVISGLCTAAFIVMGMAEGDVAMAVTTGPVFGGPFILVGALLWWGGKSLRK
jgi:hypothetical protein